MSAEQVTCQMTSLTLLCHHHRLSLLIWRSKPSLVRRYLIPILELQHLSLRCHPCRSLMKWIWRWYGFQCLDRPLYDIVQRYSVSTRKVQECPGPDGPQLFMGRNAAVTTTFHPCLHMALSPFRPFSG